MVEGDSAGGSAKQARATATRRRSCSARQDPERRQRRRRQASGEPGTSDLLQAIGAGIGAEISRRGRARDKIVVMTDADVDGAHIASLLITFFYREMPGPIRDGRFFWR